MEYETVEQARERILELEETINGLNANIETLQGEKTDLENNVQSLREINQRYYNKLIAQETTEPTDDEEEDTESLEDFARNLKI